MLPFSKGAQFTFESPATGICPQILLTEPLLGYFLTWLPLRGYSGRSSFWF
jgi:hypothetical protein